MKLSHERFDNPIDPKEHSSLRGSFAKVVKRKFDTQVCMYVCVSTYICTCMCVDYMYHIY